MFKLKVKPGWSLIELLIAMTLLGVIIAIATSVLIRVQKNQTLLNQKQQAYDLAEHALGLIEQDLIELEYIESATPEMLRLIDRHGNRVCYSSRNDTLLRNDIAINDRLMAEVVFNYATQYEDTLINDFFLCDKNRDDMLDSLECDSVCGIVVTLTFRYGLKGSAPGRICRFVKLSKNYDFQK